MKIALLMTLLLGTIKIEASLVELHRTSRAEDVIQILSDATPNDLIIFDVDEVLITLKDKILRPRAEELTSPIFDRLFSPLSNEKKMDCYGQWISQVKVEVISQELVENIDKLRSRGIKTIALTSMMPGPGPCGPIPLMEDFRFFELQKRGIDFSRSFEIDRMEFDFVSKNGRAPLFKGGILYALPTYGKGDVLTAFLNKIQFRPAKIWFVDNLQRQVDRVAKSALAMGIPYTGIQYLDQRLLEGDFDEEMGKFQFQHFEETGVWLNDEEAQNSIKNTEIETTEKKKK